MTLEKPQNSRTDRDRKSPLTLRVASAMNVIPLIKNVHVRGREHLKEIPHGKMVVVATTHISDLDMPLAIYALGKDFNLGVAAESTMLKVWQHTRAYMGVFEELMQSIADLLPPEKRGRYAKSANEH